MGHRTLPSASRPPAAARPHRARRIQHPSFSTAKEEASQPNSASGDHRKVPSRGRLARSRGIPSRDSPGRGRGFNIFGGVSPRGCFHVRCFGFHLYGKHFFPKMEHYHLPQDIFNVPATSCCESVCTAVVAVGIRTRFLR